MYGCVQSGPPHEEFDGGGASFKDIRGRWRGIAISLYFNRGFLAGVLEFDVDLIVAAPAIATDNVGANVLTPADRRCSRNEGSYRN